MLNLKSFYSSNNSKTFRALGLSISQFFSTLFTFSSFSFIYYLFYYCLFLVFNYPFLVNFIRNSLLSPITASILYFFFKSNFTKFSFTFLFFLKSFLLLFFLSLLLKDLLLFFVSFVNSSRSFIITDLPLSF